MKSTLKAQNWGCFVLLNLFRVNFSLEAGFVDDEAFVSAFADEAAFVVSGYLEDESAAVYFYEFTFTPYFHADGGCSAVGNVYKGADSSVTFIKVGFDSLSTCLFHQRNHHRGRIDLNKSAADLCSCKFICHHLFVASCDSCFKHIQIV